MSLRAIKKRDTSQNSYTGAAKPTLYRKSLTSSQQQQRKLIGVNNTRNKNNNIKNIIPSRSLQKQISLLGRATQSNPELQCFTLSQDALVRTKSDGDVIALIKSCTGNAADVNGRGLIGAKSEVCLSTISTHNYPSESQENSKPLNMLSGARSHRDLTQSAYDSNTRESIKISNAVHRRMSECSLQSSAGYSQRTSAMSASALTLSSQSGIATPASVINNAALRVPIIGYEVMEERARFTVYKLRVENPYSNDCWLVLRRYTDFVRLNTKLKQAFPQINLQLPRKKIFGDNFNSVFLDNRVQGLQIFVNSVMANEELRKCKLVREFFCLDEPPTYSESMEECRAIFEAQEETIAHLKLQISNKNDLILSLQQKIREEILEKEQIKEAFNNLSSISCDQCCSKGTTNAAKLPQ